MSIICSIIIMLIGGIIAKKLNFNVLYITYFSMIIGFAIGYFVHDKIRKNNNKKFAKLKLFLFNFS